MNALLITICLFFTAPGAVQNSPQYLEAMQKNIQGLFAAETLEQCQTVVNAFERIAQAEKDEWHPRYYATLGYVMMSTRAEATADKDKYLDQATASLQQAMERRAEESELVALEGFVYMLRTAVDPASRGAQYSGLAMQSLSRAVKMNPANPRALYLLSQMQLGMAQFFGSDTSEACATLDRAIQSFENTEPGHPLDPAWGKEFALAMKQSCP